MKNSTPNKLLTNKEAAQLLTDALEQFKDEEDNVDIMKAAVAIFDNPEPFDHQIKMVEHAVVSPESCPHYFNMWKWLGLKAVRAFQQTSD